MDESELNRFRSSVFRHYSINLKRALRAREVRDGERSADQKSGAGFLKRISQRALAAGADLYLRSADHKQAISYIASLLSIRTVRRKLYFRLAAIGPDVFEQEREADIISVLTDVLLRKLSSKGIAVPAHDGLFAEFTELVVRYGPDTLFSDDWETLDVFQGREESVKFGTVAIDPKLQHAEDLFIQACDLVEEEQAEDALPLIQEALSIDEADSAFHDILGYSYWLLERPQDALAEFTRAIALDPEDFTTYLNRGAVYHEREDYESAEADYSSYIKRMKKNPRVYLYRAQARLELGRYDEAIYDLGKAIKLDPDDSEAYYERARAFSTIPDYESALRDVDTAIRLDPDDIDYRDLRTALLEDANGF